MRITTALIVCVAAIVFQPLWAQDTRTMAVLDTELIIDMKPGPHTPPPDAVVERAGHMTAQVRKALAMSKHYEVVSLAQARETVERLRNSQKYLHDCNGCEIAIGEALGTDLIATLWVQQVSNLIINLNMVVKDVSSGEPVMTSFIDIRGNTDGTWKNGTTYMLRQFFDEYHGGPPADLERAESVWPDSGRK